ncbi:MAG: deoxyribonuclease IV [Deltaproteobacteria bacterium]|nr:deoxyribonuclease IV [Deltaproteobacteria bacterium]
MRYLGAHVSTAGGVDQAPLRAKEIQANTCQIFVKNNNQWLAKQPLAQDEIEKFFENKKACGVEIIFSHAGYLINLASPDRTNNALSLKSFAQEMERAIALNLDFVVLHPGAHVGTGMQKGIERIAQNLRRVLEKFPDRKTWLLLETTAGQGTSVGHRFEQLGAIMDWVKDIPRVGICLDTCHVFAAGCDFRTPEGYKKMWKEFDAAIGLKKLKVIHLNDSKQELGSRVDRHEHIGRGKIGPEGFRLLMRDKRLAKIPMVLETPKEDNAVKYDTFNLKKLLSYCL